MIIDTLNDLNCQKLRMNSPDQVPRWLLPCMNARSRAPGAGMAIEVSSSTMPSSRVAACSRKRVGEMPSLADSGARAASGIR
ncbi:hypothetical protein D3C77_616740 [compost metagenome]